MSGKEVNLIRLFLGLTQVEFAQEFDLAASTVARIESGDRSVSKTTKAKILRNFNTEDPEFKAFCDRMESAQ